MTAYDDLHEPAYVLEEARLRANLRLISDVARRADVEVILAFKAYALWKTFGIFREYIRSTTASCHLSGFFGFVASLSCHGQERLRSWA